MVDVVKVRKGSITIEVRAGDERWYLNAGYERVEDTPAEAAPEPAAPVEPEAPAPVDEFAAHMADMEAQNQAAIEQINKPKKKGGEK